MSASRSPGFQYLLARGRAYPCAPCHGGGRGGRVCGRTTHPYPSVVSTPTMYKTACVLLQECTASPSAHHSRARGVGVVRSRHALSIVCARRIQFTRDVSVCCPTISPAHVFGAGTILYIASVAPNYHEQTRLHPACACLATPPPSPRSYPSWARCSRCCRCHTLR